MKLKRIMIESIIIVYLSAFAILIHGYKFNTSDQKIVIPFILKKFNPILFPNDPIFAQVSSENSLFYVLMAKTMNFIPLESTFFILYLLCHLGLFFGIYLLGKTIFKSKYLAILSIMPFLMPKFVAGLLTYTYDTFFLYRLVGETLLVYLLFFIVKNRFRLSAMVAGVGALIHPISFIPNFFVTPVAAYLSKKNLKYIASTVIIILALLLPLILKSKGGLTLNLEDFNNAKWMEIIRFRDNYLSLRSWSRADWISLAFYITVFFYSVIKIPKWNRKLFFSVLISTSLAVAAGAFFVDFLNFPIFAQFQFFRSIIPLAYLALIASPVMITSCRLFGRILGSAAFIFLCLNMFPFFLACFLLKVLVDLVSANKNSFRTSKIQFAAIFMIIIIGSLFIHQEKLKSLNLQIRHPDVMTPWRDIQIWANQNTPVNAVFLVSPHDTGFRIYSQRSILGDEKDGALVAYSSQYASKWDNLMRQLDDYDNFIDYDFRKLRKDYKFNYMIVPASKKTAFPVLYKNNTYKVLKINEKAF